MIQIVMNIPKDPSDAVDRHSRYLFTPKLTKGQSC